MDKKKRSRFDIPVDGVSDRYLTIKELMQIYESFLAAKDYENALDSLIRAAETSNVAAKVKCARFLKDTPQLRMKQGERFARAEKILLEIDNQLDLSQTAEGMIAMQLAGLYEHDRPVAYLAYLLKAKRLGVPIPDKDIEGCRRRLARTDVNFFCDDPSAAYRLGVELYKAGGPFGFAEMMLREAAEAENQELAGRACLYLADLYAENSSGCQNHGVEARKYYQLAAEKGFPEVLTRKADVREPATRRSSRAYAI